MSSVKNKVSVIIVTHNSQPVLDTCLGSLKHSFNGNGYEVIAVDNGSTDDSASILRKHFHDVRILSNSRNFGFGAACNQAAREATGEYLLFLNPDVVVDEDAVDQLVDTLKRHEDSGVAVGRMRFPDGSFQATCRNFPCIDNMLYSRGSVFARFIRNGTIYTLPDYDKTTPIPAAAGTMMMIRKELFETIGGFDRRFFVFLEDVDLCLRLASQGRTNYFVPSAGAVHMWGRGSSAGKLKRNWHHHWAVWKYFRKHHRSLFTLFGLPFVLAFNFLLVTILPVSQPINRK